MAYNKSTGRGGAQPQEAAPSNNMTTTSKTSEVLGTHLVLIRTRKGWTQEMAAEASGINVRTLKGLELGEGANPNLTTLERLAEAYGITLAALFEPWQMGPQQAEEHVLCKKLQDLMADPLMSQVVTVAINALHKQLHKSLK